MRFIRKQAVPLLCALAALAGLAAVLCLLAHPAKAAPAAAAGGVRLPVIMYHSIMADQSRLGAYVISPDELESDLKYIRANGYTAVTVQDLTDHVDYGTPLPEKPIMLTFDDGYYNNYLYAYPMLKKYGMKAVLSIIGRYTDQYTLSGIVDPAYSHVTWDQINEMINSGFIEIQNHSYNLHTINNERTASMKVSGESIAHYRTALMSDVVRLQALIDSNTGHLPQCFTYPYGLISRDSIDILKEMGFRCSLTCYPGVNTITDDPNCLYMLKRLLRPHGKSAQTLLLHYQ